MNRARELIEVSKRLREDAEGFVVEATEQRVAEDQRAAKAEQAQLQAEQDALRFAQERIVIAEQAGQIAVRQREEEYKLLAQQQVRLETEQRVLAEIEGRVKAEVQASAAAEEREIAEQCAREAAQTRAMLAHEAMLAAQQRAELDEQENIRLREQTEQSRAEVEAHQLMARLRSNKKVGRLVKAAGLVSVMAFIGFSLPMFNEQQAVPEQLAAVGQPVHSVMNLAMNQADKKTIAVALPESNGESEKPATYLALGSLKLSDQLGQN